MISCVYCWFNIVYVNEQQMSKIVTRLMDPKKGGPLVMSVVINHVRTIPIFCGKTEDTGIASEWLNALMTTAQLNRWSDRCILQEGRSHLKVTVKQ